MSSKIQSEPIVQTRTTLNRWGIAGFILAVGILIVVLGVVAQGNPPVASEISSANRTNAALDQHERYPNPILVEIAAANALSQQRKGEWFPVTVAFEGHLDQHDRH